MNLRERMRHFDAPGEREAEERGWRVVQVAYERRERRRAPARSRLRPLAFVAAGLASVAIVVTPAGAAVADWIGEVVDRDTRVVSPPPLELHGGGRLLVETAAGPWVVSGDGSKRLLGEYEEATWSPGGLFVAVTSGSELRAIEPNGRVRWQRTAPGAVAAPRWAPSGFRIAYLSGRTLRVVAGDGTGDRLLAAAAAAAPPAWRPGGRHVLAFADRAGRVTVLDADTGRREWRSERAASPTELVWSSDGERLVVTGRRAIRVYDRTGALLQRFAGSATAVRPGSRDVAVVLNRSAGGSEVVLRAGGDSPRADTLFAGPGRVGGLAWSPDGRWLLIAWDGSDQWLFVSADGKRRVRAHERIAERFDAGQPHGPQVPRLAGWIR